MEMILRLLLIFYLSSLGSPFKVAIDRERCATDTACYIRESCLVIEGTITATDPEKLVRYTTENLDKGTCDVFLQIRPFTESEFQIKLEVKRSEAISSEVTLEQGVVQFRCSDGKEDSDNPKLEIVPYGDRQPYTSNSMFCSFLMRTTNEGDYITSMFANKPAPQIKFTAGGQGQSIKYNKNGNVFWANAGTSMTCNPNHLKTLDNVDASHITEKVDNTRAPIKCSTHGKLVIQREDETLDYPEILNCKENKWTYDIIKNERQSTVVIDFVNDQQETITAYCVTKFCSMCEKLEQISPCEGCDEAKIKNDPPTDCVTSTCSDDAWIFSNGQKVEGGIECKPKLGSTTEAAWYFTTKKDPVTTEEVTKGSCAKDAGCYEKAGFTLKTADPPNIVDFKWMDEAKKEIYCPKTYLLTYYKNSVKFSVNNISCSALTGRYKDNEGKEVPTGTKLFCELPPKETTTTEVPPAGAAALSKETIIAMSAGGAGLLIFGLLAFGAIFLIRRKRRFDEYQKRKRENDARIAAAAASTDLNVAIDRRNVSEKEKTRWELRRRLKRDDWIVPDEEQIKEWTNAKFIGYIMTKFTSFTPAGRIAVLMNLTALDAYSLKNIDLEVAKEDEGDKQNGTLKQFFWLWKQSTTDMLDCVVTWEYMWRFMRILYEMFISNDDHREMGKKMVKFVVSWARPMLTELTFKMRANEDDTDTNLRFLAVRMLLWAEAPDVIAELARQAELPIHELQSPMRAVVFQYAVRHLGRAQQFKDKHWEDTREDPGNSGTGRYGTMRQHILYGLCSARDETKKDTEEEYKILKETLTTIFDYSKVQNPTKSFTPLDQTWALRGAAEYVTNMKVAVDQFIILVPTEMDDTLERLMMFRSKHDKDRVTFMREAWKPHIIDLVHLAAEMCTINTQFMQLQGATGPLVHYTTTEEQPVAPIDVLKFQLRTANLNTLMCDRNVTNHFYKGVSV